MKHFFLVLLLLIIFSEAYTQKTKKIIIPVTEFGIVNSEISRCNKNQISETVSICSWTWEGSPGEARFYLNFDFSVLPQNCKIESAYLSLYSDSSLNGYSEDGHSKLSGSNEFYIKRVVSYWNTKQICWNNLPISDEKNKILVNESKYAYQDYENIDVTNLVVDILANLENSFGFVFQLKNNQYYRALVFCSPTFKDKKKRPELVINYKTAISSSAKDSYEKPKNTGNDCGKITVMIFDDELNQIKNETGIDILFFNQIIENLEKGVYLVQLVDENGNINSFKVVK